MLERPDQRLLIRRVLSALTLGFHIEGGLESNRRLATRDGLTG